VRVEKTYRRRGPALDWLRNQLADHYGYYSGVDVIALHEFKILTHLDSYDIAPRPLAVSGRRITMSYAGEPLDMDQVSTQAWVRSEGRRLFAGLELAGVTHNDVRDANILHMDERLSLIDFSMSDAPWFSISSRSPRQAWGRFNMDVRLQDLFSNSLE
jgi:RIO-like serine/threonine protein kinase